MSKGCLLHVVIWSPHSTAVRPQPSQ